MRELGSAIYVISSTAYTSSLQQNSEVFYGVQCSDLREVKMLADNSLEPNNSSKQNQTKAAMANLLQKHPIKLVHIFFQFEQKSVLAVFVPKCLVAS